MQEKQLIKRILSLVKPHSRVLIIAMFCTLMAGALTPVLTYMLKPLIDKVLVAKNTTLLNLLPFAVIILGFAKGFFEFWSVFLLEKVGQRTIMDVRKSLFEHIHSLHISFFYKTPVGELISRVISDTLLIQTAVSHALIGILKDAVAFVGCVGMIFYLDWKLALLSAVFLPLSVIPIIYIGRQHRQLSTKNQQTTAMLSNIMHETITGNRIVKAFCMEKHEIKRFSDKTERLFRIITKDVGFKSFNSSLMNFLGVLSIAGIMWYGGHQVMQGNSTPGTFFAFIAGLIMLYEPIKRVSKMNSTVQHGIAAAVRIFSLLDVKPAIEDTPGATTMPVIQNSINFKNISFSYSNNVEVLHDINLEIQRGEVLAVVGPSGSGKTTMANLIPRFFDVSSGSIEIDGLDLREVTLKSLRRQIAMVTQQTILFNDTIRNNIAYGDLTRSEQEIEDAARAANAWEFIEKLPNGMETTIGESGARLSGGQQQRLSIARALLKDAPILVLDEATSALDTESEREVQKALENLMQNRTTFVIAHRLSTIRNADRIIVMQDGEIVEEGNHDDLLAQNGVYKSLHTLQQ